MYLLRHNKRRAGTPERIGTHENARTQQQQNTSNYPPTCSARGGWTSTVAEEGRYATNQDNLLQKNYEKGAPNALDNGNSRGRPWD